MTDCATPGATVYAFTDRTEAWRYGTSAEAPPGFTLRGAAFRLAPDDTLRPHTTLYLLKNEGNGDYLVSTVPTEGAAIGYGATAALGTVFLEPVPGSVALVRYLKDVTTLRHRVSIDPADAAGWTPEPPRGYVCPR